MVSGSLFADMDYNKTGVVTRGMMVKAIRRNRRIADTLKIPARIRAGDGTLSTFLLAFLALDKEGLGMFRFEEFAAYMGVKGGRKRRGVGGLGW